jgi:hypothetical protein
VSSGNKIIGALSGAPPPSLKIFQAFEDDEDMGEESGPPNMSKHLVNPITFGVDPQDYEELFGDVDRDSDDL